MKISLETIVPSLALVLSSGCSVVGIRTEEQPRYDVLEKQGRHEIRRYSPYLTASVVTQGSFQGTQGESFRALAGYIFGKNRAARPLGMAAPVLQQPGPERIPMAAPVLMREAGARAWAMSFVIPSKYTLDTVPRPLDPRIELREVPGELLAVARYTWSFSEARAQRFEAELRGWLSANGMYEPAGEARVGGYDPPWTLPFLRRNEVLIPVRAKAAR
jgi:hypothetical protein